VRVEVSAKFASMPPRTPVHTRTVNSTSAMWDIFHLIRCVSQVNGLFPRLPGDMAHNQTHGLTDFGTRPNFWSSSLVQALCGGSRSPGPPLAVKVYADLNTFRMALVPQSE
jgi:hypothetical protein